MNTFAMRIGGLLLVMLLLVPAGGADAYRYVESSAQQVSVNTYLLTHTYTAGFLNEDVRTPIAASLDYLTEDTYPQVGFSVAGESALLAGAQVKAVVLSDAAIQDNQYLTTAGVRDTFMLIALVTLPSQGYSTADLSLVMETLPFNYTRDGELKTGVYNLETKAQTDEVTLTAGK